MQSAPSTESTGTMLMHPCLRLRYARASLTKSQDLCPRRIVLVTNCAILPMAKIVRVGLTRLSGTCLLVYFGSYLLLLFEQMKQLMQL